MAVIGRLSRSLRSELESLFAAGFADVRLHERTLAGPPACARGEDVYFTAGAYDPWTPAGREMLGHELAHVLQQRFGRVGRDNGMALELEAAIAGGAIAHGLPVRISGRKGVRPTPATQCYNVIAPAGFAAAGLAMVNPQQTVPFHATDSFLGQDKGGNPANAGSFLLGGGGVNIIAANPAAVSIRLSNNGNMAIEDVGLLNRQPKVCYLTAGITAASNAALAVQGSHFRLVPDPAGPAQRAINVGGNVLVRVTPQNVTNATAGLGMTAAQSCNTLVQDVIGHAMPQFQFINPLAYAAHPAIPEYNVARALLAAPPAALPLGAGVPLAAAMGGIATAYSAAALAALALGLGAPFTAALQNHGINEYAAPAIGQGFLSTSLIAAAAGAAIPPNPPTFSDHYHLAGGVPMIVHGTRTWNTHWGGVVAVDGADVITLENYARNTEDALAGNDTRYYFQMYTTNPPAGSAGSWHHTWTTTPMQAIAAPAAPIVPAPPPVPAAPYAAATHVPLSPGARSFANPITLMVG